ncbi:aminotransferase class I/II-fold pyridoxal phosphate-dependent enzyme [Alkalihalobacterium alkalicellulosilyticum]|uniref:aminotransferase class I/II-fold pyridoxal phosphate-dependent enzyme n=1 Tax=Alkalihalobacterium alkalicellulosilyticum TaxID=1912214 RepID=UPI000997E419|nr:aminotransferase class I/II-fold pyridoxal phosphate-dependent enzyme [Bacillus alkalicellulosilyticus]
MNNNSKKKIFLSPPHMSGNETKYIQEAMDTNWIAPLGPNVDAFEKEIANLVGVNEALAVSSGTAAIHLALILLEVKQGDVVFCSTLTFVASANPILYQGAEPVFIDSEPETWNMSPQALEKALQDAANEGKLPKAVIVVDLYGQSAKMDEIVELCNQYDVPIIEDSAESLGASYKGRASGTFGKFGIFSFNGNKIITTSSGGMLISDDEVLMKKARFLATQAKEPFSYYQHNECGYNYRLSNILAGIGRAQLEVLQNRVERRREIFSIYKRELSSFSGLDFMPELVLTRSNRWLTALTMNEEVSGISVPQLLEELSNENVEARHVWKPLHMQPLFDGNRYYSHDENTSISEYLFRTGICLPSGSSMSEQDVYRVCSIIKKLISEKSHFPRVNAL